VRRRIGLAGVLVAVLASVIFVSRFHSATAPVAGSLQQAVTNGRYVDPALCAQCHPKVWETYQRTGMARSFYRPKAETTVGNDRKTITFNHKASESYFTMLKRDGRFYQGRYQIGFDGKETNRFEKEIDYVVGSGNHVRTYLHRTSRNTLVELPLAWYAEGGGSWAMNAGYDRPDHAGFNREVSYSCIFCHNGIAEIPSGSEEPGAEPVFPDKLPEGIDCQRCHGPGSRHVQAAQTPGAKLENIREAIINPARLSAERQLELCMQCHLETTSFRLPASIVRFERGPFSYQPGEPLADFMLHFDRAPAKDRDDGNDRFEIAGAAYRLRQSACFEKSEGALRCTTCHDQHDIPHGEGASQHYTEVCRECHGAPFNKLVASGSHTQSSDCIGCHMPKRRTDDAVHVVMTDHYIQRRKPRRDLLAPIPEGREADENAYHWAVVLYYPKKLPNDADRELYGAVAQVSQDSNLAEGIKELTAAIEKYHPGRMEYYLQLGDAWRDSGQMAKALPLYEEAVRRKPDSALALQRLGFGLRSSGQLARAAEILKRALAVSPADAATWHQLGLVYLAQGSRADAMAAFKKAISLDPDMSEAFNSQGGVWFESGDLQHAISAFREAIRIRPDYAEARSNLGNALSSARSFPEARYQFEAALRFKPNYAAARYNYGVALARVNRLDEAQRQIEAALQSDPAIVEAHDLLGNLLMARGKVQSALDQFREAIRIRPDYGQAQLDMGAALADSGNAAAAIPYLRKAAESPQQAVKDEALQTLQKFGRSR
jgi:tetratricopeptide (TPR) repeat protein